MRGMSVECFPDGELSFRKLYALLFFLLGLTWAIPGSWRICVSGALMGLYVWDNGLLRMHRPMSRSFIVFAAGCALFFLHGALTNLIELTGRGYVPFHRVYQVAGLREILKVCFYLLWSYVIFRCCQRHSKDGLFFRVFAWGNIALLVIFFIGFRELIAGGELLQLNLDDEGASVSHNIIAYHFLLFFYVNLIAAYCCKSWIVRGIHWAFCCMSVIVIILTQARTSSLALLLGLLLAFMLSWKRALFGALILGILLSLIFISGNSLMPLVPDRFTLAQAARDRGSGRSMVWRDYLEYATLSDWILGRGFFACEEAILYQRPLRFKEDDLTARLRNNEQSWLIATHNMYLEVALVLGLGGLMFYLYFALKIFFRLLFDVLSGKNTWIFLSMWCSFLIWGCAEYDLVRNTNFSFFWAIALSQACVRKGEPVHELRGCMF